MSKKQEQEWRHHPEMSLRDAFAASEPLTEFDDVAIATRIGNALAGYEKPPGIWSVEHLRWEANWRAALKYLRADAMLRAREAK